jgi:hypothetical protein
MNVMWYVSKFDEATWFFFNELGLTRSLPRATEARDGGVEQRIAYQREVRAGDALAVDTTLLEVRERCCASRTPCASPKRRGRRGDDADTVYLDTERGAARRCPSRSASAPGRS